MTNQMTKKSVMQGADVIIKLGYCDLYMPLREIKRTGYTAGIYGWNADVYCFYSADYQQTIAIVTGYRPFGTVSPDHSMVAKYEDRANAIIACYGDSARYAEYMQKLIKDFIKEVAGVEIA